MSPSKPAVSEGTAYIGLGSNLGDRLGNLQEAVNGLRRLRGTRVTGISPVYETDPVSMPGAPGFLNAVVEIRTELAPEALLDACLAIEASLGRVRPSSDPIGAPAPPASRTIDLDVLLHGAEARSSERLTLPHPRLKSRAFVLVPLAGIAPGLPLGGGTAAEWAAAAATGGVRPASGALTF
jgi:2-amino-4-hydroxy-6-hydroxymethyldihydropteridine diphosphokinase